jgi:succinate dehydrogenase/fumarate reductase flavoprotein subunit
VDNEILDLLVLGGGGAGLAAGRSAAADSGIARR